MHILMLATTTQISEVVQTLFSDESQTFVTYTFLECFDVVCTMYRLGNEIRMC